jgi:hypothetical protein
VNGFIRFSAAITAFFAAASADGGHGFTSLWIWTRRRELVVRSGFHFAEAITPSYFANSSAIDPEPRGNIVLPIAAKQHAPDERGVGRAQGDTTRFCTGTQD